VRLPFVSPVRGNVGIPRQGRAMGYLFSRRARFSTDPAAQAGIVSVARIRLDSGNLRDLSKG
jgi:hypothetical protein